MTAIEAKSLIVEYLTEHDSVNYDDLNKFIKTSDDKTESLTALMAALQILTNDGVLFLNPVADVNNVKSLCWILIKPIFSHDQQVKINGELCFRIADVVNSVAEESGQKELFCDPLKLTEEDFTVLLGVISMMSENQEDNNDDDESSQEPVVQKSPPKKDKN